MTHSIIGIIGGSDALTEFVRSKRLRGPLPLHGDLGLVCLDHSDVERLVPGWSHEEMPEWDEQSLVYFAALTDLLGDLSKATPVIYLETHYFGGEGGQGAAFLDAGGVCFGPVYAAHGPINRALALLGIKVGPGKLDEFDTVGLGRYRLYGHIYEE